MECSHSEYGVLISYVLVLHYFSDYSLALSVEREITGTQQTREVTIDSETPQKRLKTEHEHQPTYHRLYSVIQSTFKSIVTKAVATRDLY